MPRSTRGPAAAAVLVGLVMTAAPTFGDEGMWLFSNPPRAQLKEKYGFEPTAEWLDHVRLSSVRFNSGGSGSFVSPDGLVMTNHHVGADDLAKLSDDKVNYLRDGFHAKTRDQEIKCKALELNVLTGIKDVTAEVNAAVKPDVPPAEAFKARQAKIEELQLAASDESKNVRADVVTLYAGGQYHLYTFKKYTDIRLVFAPEKQVAFFGGDPDNFEYPRYDLDMCFFRVYEDGRPVKPQHYLKWSPAGSKDGELVFVSGHPGRTNRQNTVAELNYLRDHGYPALLSRLNRLEVLLNAWGGRSEKNMQRAEDELFGIQNSRKARIGGLGGLLDPEIMGRKVADEQRLKTYIVDQIHGPPNAGVKPEKVLADLEAARTAFAAVEKAEKVRGELAKEIGLLEGASGFNSASFGIARQLLRAGDELPKPSGERLREYADSRLPSLKLQLFSDEPIYEDLEVLKLADGLTFLATSLGADHELVKKVLDGKSPQNRAFELINASKVREVEFRKKLFEGGKPAVDAAKDPLIELARLIDAPSRALRKRSENEVEEPKRQAYAALAKARYAMDGDKVYPDATFTLRLAYGTVKGYTENGAPVPPFTTMEGLYKRSAEQGNKGPFELPKRWEERKGKLDLSTPFNFVCTADIIGGNSGSPVVNRKGEVVGLIFDGNIQSLVLDFIFDEKVARAVSVDSRAIVESLRKVYDAPELAAELTGSAK